MKKLKVTRLFIFILIFITFGTLLYSIYKSKKQEINFVILPSVNPSVPVYPDAVLLNFWTNPGGLIQYKYEFRSDSPVTVISNWYQFAFREMGWLISVDPAREDTGGIVNMQFTDNKNILNISIVALENAKPTKITIESMASDWTNRADFTDTIIN